MGNRKMGIKATKEKKAEFLIAVNKNHGIIHETLNKCGITRYYYDMWCNNDPEFKEAIEGLPAKTLAFVESKLFKLIEEKDKTAIIFYLKTRSNGKYVETQHIKQETTFTQPLTINIIAPEIKQLDNQDITKIENIEQKKLKE